MSWQAGADVGRFRAARPSGGIFAPPPPTSPATSAFCFWEWKPNTIANLSAPAAAFALDLSTTEIPDAGLRELAGLKTLHSLDLSSTRVTASGLKSLAPLAELRSLYLRGTKTSNFGLKGVAALKAMEHLDLAGTQVTDVGLRELKPLKRLRTLELTGNAITDNGVSELTAFSELRALSLDGTDLSDEGLKELAERNNPCPPHRLDAHQRRRHETSGGARTPHPESGGDQNHRCRAKGTGGQEAEVSHVGQTKVTEAGVKALQMALSDVRGQYHGRHSRLDLACK